MKSLDDCLIDDDDNNSNNNNNNNNSCILRVPFHVKYAEQVQVQNIKHMHIRHPKQQLSKQSCSNIQLGYTDSVNHVFPDLRMTFEDFCKHFQQTAICRVINTSFFSFKKTWYEGIVHGVWRKPDRAGGCHNNKDTFLRNPQVMMEIPYLNRTCYSLEPVM